MITFSSFFALVLAVSVACPSGGNSELRPQLGSKLREFLLRFFSSCYQILVGQSLSERRENEAIKPLQGVIFHVAEIQPKRELIDVAVKMLLARVMIDAMQAAFENRPDAFNGVRSSQSTPIFAVEVVYRFVGEEKPVKAAIRSVFVGIECRANFNIVVNRLLNSWKIGVFNRHGDCSAIALTQSKNRLFTDRAASHVQLLVFMLRRFFAADVSFVNLYHAAKFVQFGAAGLSEPLEHEPCGFLGNAYLFSQLERRNSLSSSDKQIHRVNPFVKRNMRPLKDRASPHREIELASVTAVETTFANCDAFTVFTSRTGYAIRPETGFQIQPSGFCVRDRLE
jgi:hypothetical protein